MKTFVISLRSTPERLDAFRSRNSFRDDIEVFDAIDGKSLDLNPGVANAIFAPGLKYGAGAAGCAMSHRELWMRAARSQEPITVCEDDAVLHREFATQSAQVIDFVGADWDFILWGWNFDAPVVADLVPALGPCGMQFNQQNLRSNWRSYIGAPIRCAALRLRSVFGIPCYSISPNGARKFLSRCFPLREFAWTVPGFGNKVSNYGIDVALCALYQDTASFVCFPPLALSENDHAASTVQGPR